MKSKKILRKGVTAIVIVALGFFIWGFSKSQKDQKNFEIAKNLDIYYTLFRELNLFYVDEIDPDELVKESIDQMLKSLDPYTTYIPESEMDDFEFMTTGEYAGIGSLISKHGDNVVIAEPYEGSPAEKSGLRIGDVFIEVDDKEVKDLSTSDISELLRGPVAQPVKIKMLRPGTEKPFTVEIIREKIHIDPVPYYGMLEDKVGYIRLANFTVNCNDDVEAAFIDLKNNHGAEKLILDLRSNPGGLLAEAVAITNLFVDKGQEIVSTKGKVKLWDKVYRATEQPVDTLIPIVIVVNRGSASASEIVAGALQDIDRAIVLGARTFGKGLVQATRDLSYNSKLKVTTAKYYIPSGRCIQALDYSHRNEDGSVGKVPDSLITEFETKNGRKVYDGGGIIPDVTVEQKPLANITVELVRQFIFFDFATTWANKTESIDLPGEFTISEEIYNEFCNFAKEKKFDYESRSKKALDELIETAKAERYYDAGKKQFDLLEAEFSGDIEKDIEQFKEEICELLHDEIVLRFYHKKGAIESALQYDIEIIKAVELLNDHDKVNALLSNTALAN